jgi:hypothetical protein
MNLTAYQKKKVRGIALHVQIHNRDTQFDFMALRILPWIDVYNSLEVQCVLKTV